MHTNIVLSLKISNSLVFPDPEPRIINFVYVSMLDWKGSGWVIESVDAEYVNTSTYSSLPVHTLNCLVD